MTFLHKLGQIGELPEGAILCTIDVVGLYPHITHNEGLEALREALSTLEGQVESEQQECPATHYKNAFCGNIPSPIARH